MEAWSCDSRLGRRRTLSPTNMIISQAKALGSIVTEISNILYTPLYVMRYYTNKRKSL